MTSFVNGTLTLVNLWQCSYWNYYFSEKCT